MKDAVVTGIVEEGVEIATTAVTIDATIGVKQDAMMTEKGL